MRNFKVVREKRHCIEVANCKDKAHLSSNMFKLVVLTSIAANITNKCTPFLLLFRQQDMLTIDLYPITTNGLVLKTSPTALFSRMNSAVMEWIKI